MQIVLSSAGFIFTKVLKELLKYGIVVSLMFFYFLMMVFPVHQILNLLCAVAFNLNQILFQLVGFLQSQWFPVQRIGWIGFIFYFILGMLFVSEEKKALIMKE